MYSTSLQLLTPFLILLLYLFVCLFFFSREALVCRQVQAVASRLEVNADGAEKVVTKLTIR